MGDILGPREDRQVGCQTVIAHLWGTMVNSKMGTVRDTECHTNSQKGPKDTL
jgi:hypothetical protein